MFIKLTDTDGIPVHVRAEAVNMVMEALSGDGSLVWLAGDTDSLQVKETPQTVIQAVIADAAKGAHRR